MKKIIFSLVLFIISFNSISQEFIKPFYVYFDYTLKLPYMVKYTVKKPFTKLERRGYFYATNGSLYPNQYKGIGYDRGHIFPLGLCKDFTEMHNSFNMKNVVPMNPTLNRGLWRILDNRTENLAFDNDSIQVIVKIIGIREYKNNIAIPYMFQKELIIWKNNKFTVESYRFYNKNTENKSLSFFKVN